MTAVANLKAANDADNPRPEHVSPVSRELVIGLVGFAGAGCSTVGKKLRAILHEAGYPDENIYPIKLSKLIEDRFTPEQIPQIVQGGGEGASKLERAQVLQDLGDNLRKQHGNHAVASLGVKEIIRLRGTAQSGDTKMAFILDSIKHHDEVDLLRRVYDKSFKLIAIHCEREKREQRLIGDSTSDAKYAGASEINVRAYIVRDEKDKDNKHGQQVRDAFYHADFFLDNTKKTADGLRIVADLKRFSNLLLGKNLVRPTNMETGMFYAQAAALRSSCLSRQVGAALESADGRLVSTGANEVPKSSGGVYSEDDEASDGRCFAWEWKKGEEKFKGCHNSRLKNQLRTDISKWLGQKLAEPLAEIFFPKYTSSFDLHLKQRQEVQEKIAFFFESVPDVFSEMPGVKDIIEYSRSIHAEMNALFNAATQGVSPKGGTLYTTTFPCHNCARHLVTAGIKKIYYIEPFVKSLASELHSDSLTTEASEKAEPRMMISPFTGVGPRMYEEYFIKRTDLKNDRTGEYNTPSGDAPSLAVRLRELGHVEQAAAELVRD